MRKWIQGWWEIQLNNPGYCLGDLSSLRWSINSWISHEFVDFWTQTLGLSNWWFGWGVRIPSTPWCWFFFRPSVTNRKVVRNRKIQRVCYFGSGATYVMRPSWLWILSVFICYYPPIRKELLLIPRWFLGATIGSPITKPVDVINFTTACDTWWSWRVGLNLLPGTIVLTRCWEFKRICLEKNEFNRCDAIV